MMKRGPKPYYEDSASGSIIYHGDSRELVGVLRAAEVGLVLTDPPYGIGYRSKHNDRNSGKEGAWPAHWARERNFPGIVGDDKPFDPDPWLSFGACAFFGGNYCADRLPASRCWVVWNKRDGIGPNNQGDCELIWTNFDKVPRIYDHLWSGLLRAGEENVSRGRKLHPHQKPVALMRFLIEYSETTGVVLDPFMGSGSTLRAAKDVGRKGIGIEIEECYCEVAARRLSQGVLEFGGEQHPEMTPC